MYNARSALGKLAIVAAIIFVFVVLLKAFPLVFTETNNKTPCNLNDYVITNVEGENGSGILTMSIDTERLLLDFKENIDHDAIEDIPDWLVYGGGDASAEYAITLLLEGVPVNKDLGLVSRTYEIVLSKDKGLSNGDVVNVKWAPSPDKVKVLKDLLEVDFQYTDFTYTIMGLT